MQKTKKANNKLTVFLELMDRALIFKLKKKNKNISKRQIAEKVKLWYLTRPGAELGDGEGVLGDVNRFKR